MCFRCSTLICFLMYDEINDLCLTLWPYVWYTSVLSITCVIVRHHHLDTFWQQKARQYPPGSSSSLKVSAVTTKDVSSCPAFIYLTTTLPPSSYSNSKGPKKSHTKPGFTWNSTGETYRKNVTYNRFFFYVSKFDTFLKE